MLPGVCYVTRQSVHTTANVRKTKKALRKAIELQQQNKGFCLVEVVSNCPSNWKMTPLDSQKFIDDKMIPFFPLGDIKIPEGN
jgi:2-oxoglutarate ferredoxin oxidoreductase subunit beta